MTTSWTYHNQDVLREVRGATTLKYIHGPWIDEPLATDDGSALSLFHADGLSNVTSKTSTAGTVTLTRRHDAWGQPEAGTTTSGYAFTGREWDAETGLYYYRARYYDAAQGRFINEDPIGLEGGLNLYAYVGGNPSNLRDPSGLKATLRCELIPQTGYLFRHCYIEVSCQSWCFVVELWGPPKSNDPRSQQGSGRPRVGPCDPTRNSKFGTTSSPIKPPTAGPEDCCFEKKLFEEYVKAAQNVGPYSATGSNSNTFANTVINNAGGSADFPWNARK